MDAAALPPQTSVRGTWHRFLPFDEVKAVFKLRMKYDPVSEEPMASIQGHGTAPSNSPDTTLAKFDGPEGAVFIGKGTQIVGEISDCTKVVIRGRIEGNIDTKELVVQSEGSLKGNIRAELMEVHGTIEGNATVADLADIRSTGHITGELVYGKLSVASGGQVHGSIRQETPTGAEDHTPSLGNGHSKSAVHDDLPMQ